MVIAFPQVEYQWSPNPEENMINNGILCSLYEKDAAVYGLNFEKTSEKLPVFSTDMGNVSHLVPSIHPVFKIGTEVPLHTKGFAKAAGEWNQILHFFKFTRKSQTDNIVSFIYI